MKHIHFENIILVSLIILSIVLTGSLWFDNYHGLSSVIAELPFWLNETFDFNRVEYKEYIKPFKVTITNGDSNYSYYAFNSGNALGFELVKDIVSKIPESSIIESAFINEWNELKNRKSVICEFGDCIDVNVLKNIMPSRVIYSDKILNISSIAVTKSLNGVIIYIKDENNLIYRVTVDEDFQEFSDFIQTYSNSMTFTKLVKLGELGTTTFYGNKTITQNSLVLFPVSTKQSNRRSVSEITVKSFFDTHDNDSIEKIISTFFATYEYTKFTTTDNNYIYIKDDGSTIKIFNDGIFEYNSKSGESSPDSNIISSLNVALNSINNINGVENIYLLSAKKIENYYEFEFGINVDDLPVMNTKSPISDDNRVHILINVQNDRVIYYKELLNRYTVTKTTFYISSFGHNILDDVLPNIDKDTSVNIENLDLVFDVSTSYTLPVWFTTYEANGNKSFVITSAAKKRRY